jgi:hypothetical protein
MAFVGCGWATIDYTLDTDALGELRREVLVVDKTGNESPPEGARIGSYDDNATQHRRHLGGHADLGSRQGVRVMQSRASRPCNSVTARRRT